MKFILLIGVLLINIYFVSPSCFILRKYHEMCIVDEECRYSIANMACMNVFGWNHTICECLMSTYWDGSICRDKQLNGESCMNDTECRQDLGLSCNESCRCAPQQYWNGNKCEHKKTYQESCAFDEACDENLNLVCPIHDNYCNCPNASKAYHCDCVNGSYWNGNQCVSRIAYGNPCQQDYECKQNSGMICNSSCMCPQYLFWNGAMCIPKQYQESCNHNNECDKSKNLVCPIESTLCNCPSPSVPNKCDCEPDYFYNGFSCVPRKHFGGNCGNDYECLEGMYCDSQCKYRCPRNEYYTNNECVSKIHLLFNSPARYRTTTIDSFDGIEFNWLTVVKVVESPSYNLFALDIGKDMLLKFDRQLNYVSGLNVDNSTSSFDALNNGSIYLVTSNNKFFEYTSSFDFVSSKSQTCFVPTMIKYSASDDFLYLVAPSSYALYSVSKLFEYTHENLDLTTFPYATSVSFFTTSDGYELKYIAYSYSKIVVFNNQTRVGFINDPCPTTSLRDVLIDQQSHYMLISCETDDQIVLWTTDGYSHNNTGLALNVTDPGSMSFDSFGRLFVTSQTLINVFTPFDYHEPYNTYE